MPEPSPEFDFASAALRHIRDAEHLAAADSHTSRDQAWHLAGFAHECARKACIAGSWVPKLLGHELTRASEAVVDIAVALDPRSGRFPVRDWAQRHPAVSAWRPDHRYERTGTAENEADRDVDGLVATGRKAVDECILALFLDGSLPAESLA